MFTILTKSIHTVRISLFFDEFREKLCKHIGFLSKIFIASKFLMSHVNKTAEDKHQDWNIFVVETQGVFIFPQFFPKQKIKAIIK